MQSTAPLHPHAARPRRLASCICCFPLCGTIDFDTSLPSIKPAFAWTGCLRSILRQIYGNEPQPTQPSQPQCALAAAADVASTPPSHTPPPSSPPPPPTPPLSSLPNSPPPPSSPPPTLTFPEPTFTKPASPPASPDSLPPAPPLSRPANDLFAADHFRHGAHSRGRPTLPEPRHGAPFGRTPPPPRRPVGPSRGLRGRGGGRAWQTLLPSPLLQLPSLSPPLHASLPPPYACGLPDT